MAKHKKEAQQIKGRQALVITEAAGSTRRVSCLVEQSIRRALIETRRSKDWLLPVKLSTLNNLVF